MTWERRFLCINYIVIFCGLSYGIVLEVCTQYLNVFKVYEYETELDERLGQRISEQENELAWDDRPYEIWVTPDGDVSKWDYKAGSAESDSIQIFLSEPHETVSRRFSVSPLLTVLRMRS